MSKFSNTLTFSKFINKIEYFGDTIQSPYKKDIFFREYNFFKNNNLLEKLASGYRLAKMLKHCNIKTSSANYNTVSSLMYYVLYISESNPINHELFPELIIDTDDSFLPIDFTIGNSNKDRIISILKEIFNADIKIKKSKNPSDNFDYINAVIAPLPGSGEEFYSSGYKNNLFEANPIVNTKNTFRFFQDRKVDIIENTIELVNTKYDLSLAKKHIPLDDEKALSNWVLIEDTLSLDLENYIEVLKTLETYNPDSFSLATALCAFKQSPDDKSSIQKDYFDVLTGKKIEAKKMSYYCTGLLEDSYGLLIYKEQLCHILHYLSGMNYIDTILCFKAMKTENNNKTASFEKSFVEGATLKGIPIDIAISIFNELYKSSKFLLNKRKALTLLLPIYHIIYLKNNFPKMYQVSLHG